MNELLWKPSPKRVNESNLARFMTLVKQECDGGVTDYPTLYQWSVAAPDEFWRSVWSFAEVIAETRGQSVIEDSDKMPGARWFPGARLNFAENLLRRRGPESAIIFRSEKRGERLLSYTQLYQEVSRLSQVLREMDIQAGDRIAGYMPNLPETVIAMLAASSLGAVWCSCSPDFGVRAVVDRLGQIRPRVLFSADGYYYNGKAYDSLANLTEILEAIPSIEQLLVVPYTREFPRIRQCRNALLLEEFTAGFEPHPIRYARLPFDHPLYILFSSGTTGVPKCIVHGAGGTLLQHLKEHQLHVDLRPGDRLFYYTTCGWMMWNWLVSGLASGTTLVLYDGSPFFPDGHVLFDYADTAGMTVFGTSAKYLDAVKKRGLVPRISHNLSTLKTILSTGSPLSPKSFDFVYDHIKKDVCLSSIAGGTDIISCFVLGNPLLPVRRGEIQCRGLGMKVEIFDDGGRSVRGEKGELVCTAPFPSMPLGFWNDAGGKKFRAAYFERYPNVWCHGDYAELTGYDGIIIYGRSDTVLNPGGVRIGTAEIYRQVEELDEVLESVVIGQEWEGDVRVVLFVRLQAGAVLNDGLIDKIKDQIRRNTTPRHVPARVIQVADIPRTRSGKIAELAVRDAVHHRCIKNEESLANPESLDLYRDLAELG